MVVSGTDDNSPPSNQNRGLRDSSVSGDGRSAVGCFSYSRINNNMEAQIHQLEQEAYASVLRAFKAQSDALTWEKEGLITELRKELRVSDDEHRELLTRVNADEIIHRIREWRQTGSYQPRRSTSQPVHDILPSPAVSGSRKKQKTSQSCSFSAAIEGAALRAKCQRPNPIPINGQSLPVLSSVKSMQYTSAGPGGGRPFLNRSSSSVLASNAPVEAASFDPLIGKKVWTRWPEDNHFYEAVITDYNAAEGRHALVYDIHTAHETWEWVDLKEIPLEDIRWEGDDPGISHRGGHGRGLKKSFSSVGETIGAGRGRALAEGQSRKEFPPPQNGIGNRVLDDIELLNTDSLVKEVGRVFSVNQPDPVELEKAKKMLKEHEQALTDAIARLADASDGESDGEDQFLHGRVMEMERG